MLIVLRFFVIVNYDILRKEVVVLVVGITEYGKAVKGKLNDMNRTQSWLVSEVARRTGMYFDSSYLHKVMTGKLKSEKILTAINEVLGIE